MHVDRQLDLCSDQLINPNERRNQIHSVTRRHIDASLRCVVRLFSSYTCPLAGKCYFGLGVREMSRRGVTDDERHTVKQKGGTEQNRTSISDLLDQ